MQNLIHVKETGPSGGIDQSKQPRRGSVEFSYNAWTGKGDWRSRPGFLAVESSESISLDHGFFAAEYIPDHNYTGSNYYTQVLLTRDGSTRRLYEYPNTEGFALISTETGLLEMASFSKYSSVSCLLRYTSDITGDASFTPCVLFSNGIDVIQVYHQIDGVGSIEDLVSIDGGDSDLSYLEEPPRPKILKMFKDRVFAINTEDGANVVRHTTADSSGIFTANTWPSTYSFTVGGPEPITAAEVWNDSLVLFKQNEIWVVRGDGVEGVWQLTQVDSKHGAIHSDAVVEVGNLLYFIGVDGIYRWDNQGAVNITKEKLSRLWGELDFISSKNRSQCVYDKTLGIVIFTCTRGQTFKISDRSELSDQLINTWLVYNINKDTFDLWGMGTGGLSSTVTHNHDLGYVYSVDNWTPGKSVVFSFPSGVGTAWYIRHLSARSTVDRPGDHAVLHHGRGIHAQILSHPYASDDTNHKLCRRISIHGLRTGDWDLHAVIIPDNETFIDALTRRAGGVWNIVEPHATYTDVEMGTDSTSNFTTAASGPVDLYHIESMHKSHDSAVLVAASSAEEIKFNTAPARDDLEHSVVVEAGTAVPGSVYINMLKSGTYPLGDASTKLGEMRLGNVGGSHRFIDGVNVKGRNFRIWLSNMSYYTVNNANKYLNTLVREPGFKITGWELWINPRRVSRP